MLCCRKRAGPAPVVTHAATTLAARRSISRTTRPLAFCRELIAVAYADQSYTVYGAASGALFAFNWAVCRATELLTFSAPIRALCCIGREAYVGLSDGTVHLVSNISSENCQATRLLSRRSAIVALTTIGSSGNLYLCVGTKDCNVSVYRLAIARLSYTVARGTSGWRGQGSKQPDGHDDTQTTDDEEEGDEEKEDTSLLKPEWVIQQEYATPTSLAGCELCFGYGAEDLSFYYCSVPTQRVILSVPDPTHFPRAVHIFERSSAYGQPGTRMALLGYNGENGDGGHVRLVNLGTGEGQTVFERCPNGCLAVYGVLYYAFIAEAKGLTVLRLPGPGVARGTPLHSETFESDHVLLKCDFTIISLNERGTAVCASLLFTEGEHARMTLRVTLEDDAVNVETIGSAAVL
ncbi:hypothetical protein GMRT_11317 [Giardia muris]|uniref:WD40 repeat protein n=1 Tax=Giardia muris TaxID=5742 RepID=A0A4Z1T2J1_GIAMU|nr:hypothetical protein GMRT_11317 [Giardia muris]|eukprot:TNJ26631.1 hypothetical protein GMRT_11317 [Giardia muris]